MYNIITALNTRRYRYVVRKQNNRNNNVYRKSTFLNVFIKNMMNKSAPVQVAAPEPAQVQVAAPEPAQVQVAAPEPAQVQVAEPEPAQVQVAEPEPAQVQVAEPEPAQVHVAEPEPAPMQEYEEFIAKRKERMKIAKQMMSAIN